MYSVIFKASAKKELAAFPRQIILRIKQSIVELAKNPLPHGVKKLKNTNGEFFRIRVASYRIVYEIRKKELIILIVKIAHRKEVYRN